MPAMLDRFTVLLMVGLFCAMTGPAHANGLEIGRDPGGTFPVANDDVQLVSEEVVVAPGHHDSPGHARCHYLLRNLGSRDRSLTVAFYVRGVGSGVSMDYPRFASHLDFQVTQDGRELPVRWEAIDPQRWRSLASAAVDSLPVWSMSIPALAESRLVLDYQVVWSGGGDGYMGHSDLTYHARPASLWAGTIESAVIEIHLDPATMELIESHGATDDRFSLRITPAGYEREGNIIRWRFRNWDASEDPRVSLAYTAW